MLAHIRDIAELRGGSFSLGGTHYLNAYILPEILAGFSRQYPGVQLNIFERSAYELSRMLAGRELDDHEILPATLCPELINGLLKTELGFNGMVVTDASHMIGMFGAMPRSQQLPAAIAAGCDMFLFFNDPDEDFGYMMDGYKNGVITEERMQDALRRILGVKASIGLHKKAAAGTLMPPKENITVVGGAALLITHPWTRST